MKTTETKTKEKLFFLQDLSSGSSRQVYSGHTGTGKKFKMYNSDYGKYAMQPATEAECKALITKIETAANGACTFQWNIVPITEIDLVNFYEEADQDAFDALKKEQAELFPTPENQNIQKEIQLQLEAIEVTDAMRKEDGYSQGDCFILRPKGVAHMNIATVHNWAPAKYTKRIVKCVNMHDELVNALRAAASELRAGNEALTINIENLLNQAKNS